MIAASKNVLIGFAHIVVSLACMPFATAQKVIGYGPDQLSASVHYNQFLYSIYEKTIAIQPAYPVKGAYSPTGYSHLISATGVGKGVCNYVYVPTKGLLAPGQQYRITVTIKFGSAYAGMPYYQEHFGVALTSDLYNNSGGLWRKHFHALGITTVEEPVSASFVFRPLCTSSFVVVGVFQGPTMDTQDCFACPYGFEVYDLLIELYDDPNADFVYLCDAFEEDRFEKKYSTGYDTDTVYFDSGSAALQEKYSSVIDSIPSKLRTKQDLVTLYAYTDAEGEANESLGAARNCTVREALMSRGVDSSRIITVNFGETKASGHIKPDDRRVEIDVNGGKLYQKYYSEAIRAAVDGDYQLAKVRMMRWASMVPPDNAIYALFDCWGEGDKSIPFLRDLYRAIQKRAYPRGNELKFILDSLYCEDQQGRTLLMHLKMNHLPDFPYPCQGNYNAAHKTDQGRMIDSMYALYNFPTVEEVGTRGNKVLPYMIIHATDTTFQKRYLPIIQQACEEERISWEYYAMLYDKISVARSGKQRYGTQWAIDAKGILGGMIPFEDEEMVHEYRKQVGLVPLSDF